MELYKFKAENDRFTIVCKPEFLQKCPTPEKFTMMELFKTYKLNQYLHNPVGPAAHCSKTDKKTYWIDGHHLSDEEGAKIEHTYKFNNRLKDIINE